jgi:hypothetical protein
MAANAETAHRDRIAERVLRILHLEDSEPDHVLVQRQLARDGVRAE